MAARGRSLPRADGSGATWTLMTPDAVRPPKGKGGSRFDPLPGIGGKGAVQLDLAPNQPTSPNSPLGRPIEDPRARDASSRATPKRARDPARSLPRVDLGPDASVKELIEAMEAKVVALQEG